MYVAAKTCAYKQKHTKEKRKQKQKTHCSKQKYRSPTFLLLVFKTTTAETPRSISHRLHALWYNGQKESHLPPPPPTVSYLAASHWF